MVTEIIEDLQKEVYEDGEVDDDMPPGDLSALGF
jgi:hypothetical protein